MTITLTGQITCLDGQFRARREIRCQERPLPGDAIGFSESLCFRVGIGSFAVDTLRGEASIYAVGISLIGPKLPREDAEILFTSNGFEILPAREGE